MGKVKAKAKSKVQSKVKAKSKPTKLAKKAKPVKAKALKTKPKTTKPVKSAKSGKTKKAAPLSAKNLKTKTIPQKTTTTPTKKVDYAKVLTPLGDRLVVRLVTAERMTAGGLYIPDTVSNVQGHLKGEVLAAGSGARNKKGNKRPLDVTVGDKIYFNEYSTTKITFGLEELHIVKEIDVLGVAQ